MTLTQLTAGLTVSKSTAFALLQTLISRGYVADSGTRLSRRYRLGMTLAVEAGMPARTPRTITDPDALLRDLALSAARGYAIDDEEDGEGVFCVGAPVYDRTGVCVAAVSGTGLKLNRPSWRIDELGVVVRDAADSVTVALGGPPFAERQHG
jgi:DNA-binding IclR family transcriptional regulator